VLSPRFRDRRLFYGEARDLGFLPPQRDRFLIPLCLFDPPNVHLFFEYEVPFHFEDFFNDGDDGDIALLTDGGHGLNGTVDGDMLDFDLLVLQELIDQLLMVMGYSRDAHTRCFNNAFGNRELFFKDRDDSFTVYSCGRGIERVRAIKGRIHREDLEAKATVAE